MDDVSDRHGTTRLCDSDASDPMMTIRVGPEGTPPGGRRPATRKRRALRNQCAHSAAAARRAPAEYRIRVGPPGLIPYPAAARARLGLGAPPFTDGPAAPDRTASVVTARRADGPSRPGRDARPGRPRAAILIQSRLTRMIPRCRRVGPGLGMPVLYLHRDTDHRGSIIKF
jgi:hypothetical protein